MRGDGFEITYYMGDHTFTVATTLLCIEQPAAYNSLVGECVLRHETKLLCVTEDNLRSCSSKTTFKAFRAGYEAVFSV